MCKLYSFKNRMLSFIRMAHVCYDFLISDAMHIDYMKRIHSHYENLWQDCLEEVEKFKVSRHHVELLGFTNVTHLTHVKHYKFTYCVAGNRSILLNRGNQ